MGNIFTRKALKDILANGQLTAEQKTEQVFALYGRALDDGYIAKAAAKQAQETALEQARAAWLESSMSRQAVFAEGENHPVSSAGLDGVTRAEWEKGLTTPDPKESDEYKALQNQFNDYKAMQAARISKDFEGVKPKFFETVYGLVDRGEGAKSLQEQLAGIREQYEEYFTPAETNPNPNPGNPSAPYGGTSPFRGGIPAVVLPTGGNPAPGAKLTLGEAMRRANAGEAVDVSLIGK